MATKPWTHDYFIVDGWLSKPVQVATTCGQMAIIFGRMATKPWSHGY